MTVEEFNNLEVGDTVYYYTEINTNRISTMTAALKKKKVGSIRTDGKGGRYVAFEPSGVILRSILHMFDTDKKKLLYVKVKHIKRAIKEAYEFKKAFNPNLNRIYADLLRQKNVQPMLEQYPELLI